MRQYVKGCPMKNPCINCISFAICNTKLKENIKLSVLQFRNSDITHYKIALSINETIGKCSILNNYIKQCQIKQLNSDIVKDIAGVYNINMNTDGDLNYEAPM